MLRNTLLCPVALTSAYYSRVPGPQTNLIKKGCGRRHPEIEANGDQRDAAFNSNNLATVAAFYTDDAILVCPNQADVECRQTVQPRLEAYFRESPTAIKHTPLKTYVAGDWAFEHGNSIEIVTPKSVKTFENSINCPVTLKLGHGSSWKVYPDISNNSLKEPS